MSTRSFFIQSFQYPLFISHLSTSQFGLTEGAEGATGGGTTTLDSMNLNHTLNSNIYHKYHDHYILVCFTSPMGKRKILFILPYPYALATSCEEPTHWKRPWCWEKLKAEGEAGDRGWDGWMASPMRWTWVWASSGSWRWTGKPGCCSPWGHTMSWTWLSDWIELNSYAQDNKDGKQEFLAYFMAHQLTVTVSSI